MTFFNEERIGGKDEVDLDSKIISSLNVHGFNRVTYEFSFLIFGEDFDKTIYTRFDIDFNIEDHEEFIWRDDDGD